MKVKIKYLSVREMVVEASSHEDAKKFYEDLARKDPGMMKYPLGVLTMETEDDPPPRPVLVSSVA